MLQSTASDRGIVVETRVTGSTGTAWIEGVGDTVRVADASGVRTLAVPDDLRDDPPPPLPDGAVTTTYEQMTTFGVEYGPYTRLAAAFRDRIRGVARSGPEPATFADGVAQMAVLDAARRSARRGGEWIDVERTETSAVAPGIPRRSFGIPAPAPGSANDQPPRCTVASMAVARLDACGGGPVNRRGPPPAGATPAPRRRVPRVRRLPTVCAGTTDSDSFKFAAAHDDALGHGQRRAQR